MNAQAGDIIISYNRSGILAPLIRFFTKSKWSHAALILGNVQGIPSVLEASLLVQVVPFERYLKSKSESFRLYRLRTGSGLRSVIAASEVYRELAGDIYAITTLFWFIKRWWVKLWRGIDLRSGNPLKSGTECSELVWHYFNQYGSPLKELVAGFEPETISPQDLFEILEANPSLFEMIGEQ